MSEKMCTFAANRRSRGLGGLVALAALEPLG